MTSDEIQIDWKRLSPHLPVAKGDAAYVKRPFDGAERLAMKVRAGIGPIAVAGPVGCGKSTELAAAAALLEPDFTVLLLQLDRLRNLRLQDVLDGETFVMGALIGESNALGYISSNLYTRDEALRGLRALKAARGERELVLLLDGLEKMPAERASEAVAGLMGLRDEAKLVLVVPPSLVTGPDSYALSSADVKLFPIRAVPVEQDFAQAGRFLKEIAARRLGLSTIPSGLDPVVNKAITASGGLPRLFLQILQDAAGYASLEERTWPSEEDLRNALQDHAESFQRLMREGDAAALAQANGTDGLEIPLERRLRLISHGLLLEYPVPGGRPVVRQHPLTKPHLLKVFDLS